MVIAGAAFGPLRLRFYGGWLVVVSALTAVALALVFASVAAQDLSAPLPIDSLLAAPTLAVYSLPTFDPAGAWVAYTVTDNRRRPAAGGRAQAARTGVPWFALGGDIWLFSTTGEPPRNLTQGKGNNWAPSWSPDGRRIAFFSDRGGTAPVGAARLWIWDRTSGMLRQVGDVQVKALHGGRPEWTAEGRQVVTETYPEGVAPGHYAEVVTGHSARRHPVIDHAATVSIFRFDPAEKDSISQTDQLNLDMWASDLVVVDTETGVTRRVAGNLRIGRFVLSPNRRLLAWATVKRYERSGSLQILMDLVIHDFRTGRSRVLVSDARLTEYPATVLFSWSPTNDALGYRTRGPDTKDELYVVPLNGGASRRIARAEALRDDGLPDDQPLWDRRGHHVFFLRGGALWRAAAGGGGAAPLTKTPGRRLQTVEAQSGQLWCVSGERTTIVFTLDIATKRAGLARVDLTSGEVTQLVIEAKRYGGNANYPAVSPDGNAVAFVAEDAGHPPDIWLRYIDSLSHARQISRVAPELEQFGAGNARLIEWRGLDGDTLRGALIYPGDYRVGTRYPLIVKVYGGTNVSDDLNRFGFGFAPFENLQVFASRGYAVLLADSRLNVGTPMIDLLKTVMPGVDRVIDLGMADPNRMGITGFSYGGYSALALIAQSRRFKAAVMRAGQGDLIGMYSQLSPDGTNFGLAWAETGQGRMGGTPWELPQRYIANSPFFYLDRVQTPLLIIHGADDPGVPPFLADQIFVGLRRLGKRVEYARYVSGTHWEGEWTRANQADALKRVVDWFDRFLKSGLVGRSAATR